MRRSLITLMCFLLLSGCASPLGGVNGRNEALRPAIDLLGPQQRDVLCPEPSMEAGRRAETLLTNSYELPPHPPVKLRRDLNWSADPLSSRNWQFQFQALRYLWDLDAATELTGDERFRERAIAVAHDWVNSNPRIDPPSDFSWNDHSTAWRTKVLSCLYERAPEPWLHDALEQHLEVLSDPRFYAREGNHALNQDIGLFHAACALGDQTAAALAVERMTSLLVDSVDVQGVTNEQAVGYQWYNLVQYRRARELLETCGADVPADFARLDAMPRFLGHATLPDGTYETLGDTDRDPGGGTRAEILAGTDAEFATSAGRRGSRPSERFAVFSEGFAFARSGWGEDRPFAQESHLSLRFGGPREFHGHHDQGAITFYSHGTRLLVDPGKYAYQDDPIREYIVSPSAHNLVISSDCWRHEVRDHRMYLKALVTSGDNVLARIGGRVPGCRDATWERSLVFAGGGRYLLVVDEVAAKALYSFHQRWHLEIGAQVRSSESHVRATVDDAEVHVMTLSGSARTEIITGQEDPFDGWASPRYGEVAPAPVIDFSEAGDRVTFVSVIVPADRGEAVDATLVNDPERIVVDVTRGSLQERLVLDGTDVEVSPIRPMER